MADPPPERLWGCGKRSFPEKKRPNMFDIHDVSADTTAVWRAASYHVVDEVRRVPARAGAVGSAVRERLPPALEHVFKPGSPRVLQKQLVGVRGRLRNLAKHCLVSSNGSREEEQATHRVPEGLYIVPTWSHRVPVQAPICHLC